MATKWESSNIKCPYYRGTEARNSKCYISCEALPPAACMMMFFPSWEARRKHMELYCKNDRYWACVTCETLDAILYRLEEEGEQ